MTRGCGFSKERIGARRARRALGARARGEGRRSMGLPSGEVWGDLANPIRPSCLLRALMPVQVSHKKRRIVFRVAIGSLEALGISQVPNASCFLGWAGCGDLVGTADPTAEALVLLTPNVSLRRDESAAKASRVWRRQNDRGISGNLTAASSGLDLHGEPQPTRPGPASEMGRAGGFSPDRSRSRRAGLG
jgi:hypothetical protein